MGRSGQGAVLKNMKPCYNCPWSSLLPVKGTLKPSIKILQARPKKPPKKALLADRPGRERLELQNRIIF
jgi:hypothetical protein